jgi:RNA polymerase sigma-70 factor (ECF subfamily)
MLADELKNGSREAFATLVNEYSQDIIRNCYSFVHNREDAEDLAQEVFVEVYKSIRRFRKDSDIGTWLYRISVNKSLDFLRRRKRKKRLSDLRELFALKSKPAPEPHRKLEEAERKRLLHEKIELLPENQKIAIVLSQFEAMSNKKIANIMETSESAVEALLHRARQNLRKHLEDYFEKIYK